MPPAVRTGFQAQLYPAEGVPLAPQGPLQQEVWGKRGGQEVTWSPGCDSSLTDGYSALGLGSGSASAGRPKEEILGTDSVRVRGRGSS